MRIEQKDFHRFDCRFIRFILIKSNGIFPSNAIDSNAIDSLYSSRSIFCPPQSGRLRRHLTAESAVNSPFRCAVFFSGCAAKDVDLENDKGPDKDDHDVRIRPRAFSNEMFRTPHHHGSFYLRIGAVAFGVGSMIYSGLEFAQYFEFDITSHCHDILMAITPAARMVFTFIQMYFIFLNAKMTIYENKAIAYFGLMHMLVRA